MHILSLSDIQLIVDLFETQGAMSHVNGREHQIDNLIRTGYLRPLSGAYVLTELGEKTARSLQMRQFVPPRATPAPEVTAEPEVTAKSEVPAEPATDTPALEGQ